MATKIRYGIFDNKTNQLDNDPEPLVFFTHRAATEFLCGMDEDYFHSHHVDAFISEEMHSEDYVEEAEEQIKKAMFYVGEYCYTLDADDEYNIDTLNDVEQYLKAALANIKKAKEVA